MSSELTVTGSLQITNMDDLQRVAKMLALSGYFADAKDQAQCGVKVLAGQEMGIGAFASMNGIHIIKGKPCIGANLMAAAVKRSGRYNYRVKINTAEVCEIEFYERWDSGKFEAAGTSIVTMKEIDSANLNKEWDKEASKWKEKHNWKAYPKNMLFARAMSNGVKWYCPDVFLGNTVYTHEELGAEVDDNGDIVTIPVEVVAQDASVPMVTAIASNRDQIMSEIDEVIKQLEWSTKDVQAYMVKAYKGKTGRSQLTDKELSSLLDYLSSGGGETVSQTPRTPGESSHGKSVE